MVLSVGCLKNTQPRAGPGDPASRHHHAEDRRHPKHETFPAWDRLVSEVRVTCLIVHQETVDAEPNPEKRRLLAAARAEFIDHGIRRTSVAAIAARADVDRSTLFRHCGNKDAMVRAVLSNEALEFFAGFALRATELTTPEERAVEAFVEGMRQCRTNPLVQAINKFEPETIMSILPMTGTERFFPVREAVADLVRTDSMEIGAARRAAELMIRLVAMFLMAPTDILPVDSDEKARGFAQTYFVPLMKAAVHEY